MNKTTREFVALDPPSPLMVLGADWPQLAHRELVRRIVVSPTFAKSERLRSLRGHFNIAHIMRAISRTARDQERRDSAAISGLRIMLRALC